MVAWWEWASGGGFVDDGVGRGRGRRGGREGVLRRMAAKGGGEFGELRCVDGVCCFNCSMGEVGEELVCCFGGRFWPWRSSCGGCGGEGASFDSLA